MRKHIVFTLFSAAEMKLRELFFLLEFQEFMFGRKSKILKVIPFEIPTNSNEKNTSFQLPGNKLLHHVKKSFNFRNSTHKLR